MKRRRRWEGGKYYSGTRGRARNLAKVGKNTGIKMINEVIKIPGGSRLMINSPRA